MQLDTAYRPNPVNDKAFCPSFLQGMDFYPFVIQNVAFIGVESYSESP